MGANVTDILKRNKIVFNEDVYDIQMINNKKLHRSKFQFYIERDIEQFADELEVVGKVLQPLVIRELNIGYYEILAGHRRHLSAVLNVEKKELSKFVKLPCYIIDVDDVMAEYILIKTNASREKDTWEQMHEIERLKYLIPLLPANKDLKGRLQDHVASELGLTKSVVGRYEHIANKLSEKGKKQLKEGHLNITTADKLASFSADAQDHLLHEFGHDLQVLNNALTKRRITKKKERKVVHISKEAIQALHRWEDERSNVEENEISLHKANGNKLIENLYEGNWDADDVKVLGLSLEQLEEVSLHVSIENFKNINAFRMFYENISIINSKLAGLVKKLAPMERELYK